MMIHHWPVVLGTMWFGVVFATDSPSGQPSGEPTDFFYSDTFQNSVTTPSSGAELVIMLLDVTVVFKLQC